MRIMQGKQVKQISPSPYPGPPFFVSSALCAMKSVRLAFSLWSVFRFLSCLLSAAALIQARAPLQHLRTSCPGRGSGNAGKPSQSHKQYRREGEERC